MLLRTIEDFRGPDQVTGAATVLAVDAFFADGGYMSSHGYALPSTDEPVTTVSIRGAPTAENPEGALSTYANGAMGAGLSSGMGRVGLGQRK